MTSARCARCKIPIGSTHPVSAPRTTWGTPLAQHRDNLVTTAIIETERQFAPKKITGIRDQFRASDS
jgi:hypothetical protein